MKRTRAGLVLGAAMAAALSAQTTPSFAHNDTGTAVAAGIVGLALGAAIASSADRDRHVYGPPPVPAYAPPPPFSPAGGVICYPAQQTCYNNNGVIAWSWTSRVYGPR